MNQEIEIPSATGIGTAESLAKVYGIIANGGKTLDGKRLLSEKLIKMIEDAEYPDSPDQMLGMPLNKAYGFSHLPYQVFRLLLFFKGIFRQRFSDPRYSFLHTY